MRRRLQAILLFIALSACSAKLDRKSQEQVQQSYPSPTILQHKIRENVALSLLMKEQVPAVLELLIANAGGAGDVRIRAEQAQAGGKGLKSWEERVHFAAGEQRTIRVNLPGAEAGIIGFDAQPDPPPPLVLATASQPKAKSFWGGLLRSLIIGGIAGLIGGLLAAVFKRRNRAINLPAGDPPRFLAESNAEAVCQICGTRLQGADLRSKLCPSCQRRATDR